MYRSSSCLTDQQNFLQNNFNKTTHKKKKNMHQTQTQKSLKIKVFVLSFNFLFFFFIFFFFFHSHIMVLFSFFGGLLFQFFSNSHWFGMYIFFPQSLICFCFVLFLCFFTLRSITHSLSFTPVNSLGVRFFLIFFLFCLKIPGVLS